MEKLNCSFVSTVPNSSAAEGFKTIYMLFFHYFFVVMSGNKMMHAESQRMVNDQTLKLLLNVLHLSSNSIFLFYD